MTSTRADKVEAFRTLHNMPGLFIMPNPWDVGSIRIFENYGFKALATTSTGMAFSLGLADGAVCPELVLNHCRTLANATALPLSADLEKGFDDDPQSVYDTIIAAAGVGLAGGSIEDHTGDPNNPIFEEALAVERVAAAVEASNTVEGGFVLTARCENLLWDRPNLDDVIHRLAAYEAVGAEVLYAPALRDLEQITELCAALSAPVNVVMEQAGTPFSVEQLTTAGVKRISVGGAPAQLAYGSVARAAQEMANQKTFTFTQDAMDFYELEALIKGSNS